MSALPSLLKSPVPTTLQLAPGLGSVACDVTLVPFISQICGVPAADRHRGCGRRVQVLEQDVGLAVAVEVVLHRRRRSRWWWWPWLRLLEPAPSLIVQVSVRVGLAPELVGLAPDENVTLSSTCW